MVSSELLIDVVLALATALTLLPRVAAAVPFFLAAMVITEFHPDRSPSFSADRGDRLRSRNLGSLEPPASVPDH
jgi:hypothetical protein